MHTLGCHHFKKTLYLSFYKDTQHIGLTKPKINVSRKPYHSKREELPHKINRGAYGKLVSKEPLKMTKISFESLLSYSKL